MILYAILHTMHHFRDSTVHQRHALSFHVIFLNEKDAQHMKNGMSMAVRIPASPVLHTYIKLDHFWSVYLFT